MIPGKLLFFCSCMIFVLSIINLSLGPIITKRIGSDWDTYNCEKKSDDFLDYYKNHPNMGIQSYNDSNVLYGVHVLHMQFMYWIHWYFTRTIFSSR